MTQPEGPVLVTGATGAQGGAVARALLRKGWRVRALTRNPERPAARALAEAGAELVRGDMEDDASVHRAVAGCHGVFSVQNYWEKGVGFEGEIRQGKRLADAAKAAGVKHFVQASIAGEQGPEAPEHFRCKWEIEKHVNDIGVPATFLRETFFMENFLHPKQGQWVFPMLAGSLRPETRFHMLSVEDIGETASVVFGDPARYLGKALDLAGDALTVPEMKQVYQRVTGRKAPGFSAPFWMVRLVNQEMARQLNWNNAVGWKFPVEEFRAVLPHATRFEQFVAKHMR